MVASLSKTEEVLPELIPGVVVVERGGPHIKAYVLSLSPIVSYFKVPTSQIPKIKYRVENKEF